MSIYIDIIQDKLYIAKIILKTHIKNKQTFQYCANFRHHPQTV